MEFLFEFLFELIFEGVIDASKNKKIPKIIRYPLIFLIIMFFTALIGLFIFIGLVVLNKSIIAGLFILIIGLLLAYLSIMKFKSTYLKNYNNKNN